MLELGMAHLGLRVYKVYIYDDSGLNMPFFTARSNLAEQGSYGGIFRKSSNGK